MNKYSGIISVVACWQKKDSLLVDSTAKRVYILEDGKQPKPSSKSSKRKPEIVGVI